MAHFAKVNTDNIVEQVIVVSDLHAPDPYPESEILGQHYLHSLGLEGNWLQTSYNHTFRKNYAGVGFTYRPDLDAFVPPQPYPSWSLDTQIANWVPPVPYPTEIGNWEWDETNTDWVQQQIPDQTQGGEA